MSLSRLSLQDLRDFFLDHQEGSPAILDKNFGDAIKVSDTWHNHAIFLYHAAKNATVRQSYGTNTEAAADAINKHLREWTEKALKMRGTPEPWMIPQTLTAFTMLRVRPPAKFVEFCERSAMTSLKRWQKTQVLEWFSSAAELGIESNEGFVKQVCQRLIMLAPGMKGHELHELARNMATMDAILEARRAAKSPHIAQAFRQVFTIPAVVMEVERTRNQEEPQKLGDAIYWFARQKAAFPRSGIEQNSGLQWLVADQFKAAGAHPIQRHVVKDTGHEIDLSFSFNGCNFDVEVDGPCHFIRCTDGHIITLDGASVFQTLLMQAKNPERKIIRLPYTVYSDHVDKPEMWRELCAEIQAAKPGSYLVDSFGKLNAKLMTRCSAYPVYADQERSRYAAPAA